MAKACSLLLAKKEFDAGNYGTAKSSLEKMDINYSYDGVSVATMLETLNKYGNWIDVAGQWSSTSGQGSTHSNSFSVSWYDGGGWTYDISPSEYAIDIKCKINSDGTVNVSGGGYIFVFTDWSSIQSMVQYDKNHKISFDKRVDANSFSTPIQIDSYTTITLAKDKITLNYKYVDQNDNTMFYYTHKTNITYGKKTKTY